MFNVTKATSKVSNKVELKSISSTIRSDPLIEIDNFEYCRLISS
jgi:hypothetical protein